MVEFKIIKDQTRNLTHIEFLGKVNGSGIINAMRNFYDSEITLNVLWDFTDCDVTGLSYDDLTLFVEAAKSFAHQRINGKSALVGPNDLAFGLGRMMTSLNSINNYPVQSEIFRTVEDAMAWLDS